MTRLRIFYAADTTPNAFIPSSRLWYNNLFRPLVELGHDVVPFDYDLTPHFRNLDPRRPDQQTFIEENRPHLERALLQQVERAHRDQPIQVFFSYFYSACVTAPIIEEIKRLGIVTVNFYCNAIHQFRLVEAIAPAYHYCMVPERLALDHYREVGATPIHIQMAANPRIYKPYPVEREHNVTFVGQQFADRSTYVSYLHHNGIPVRVWGHRWDVMAPPLPPASAPSSWSRKLRKLASREGPAAVRRRVMNWRHARRAMRDLRNGSSTAIPPHIVGPPLSDQDLVKMYSRSNISLGFSASSESEPGGKRLVHVRLRDFEAPMSGAFYLVEYQQELEEYFEIGKEIVCYHDKKDLLEKVRYFLRNPGVADRIRQAGRTRACRDHTWTNRFVQLFQAMGMDG